METTERFSGSNKFGNTLGSLSACSLVMLYKAVKIQPISLGAISVSRNFMFLLVPQQPAIPSTNGGHQRIQRIK